MAVWVYAELRDGAPASSALELLAKARELDPEVAAVALGAGATEAAGALGDHGAAIVYASDDAVFDEHPGRPAAHVLDVLVGEHRPRVVLFSTSYDARDVAGRLQARTGSTLVGNATDVPGPDRARTEMHGGASIVDVELGGPDPKLILCRPGAFAAEAVGGAARVVPVQVEVPEQLLAARRVERHREETEGPSLEDARVVVAGGRGMRGAEQFALLEDLAAAIGDAAVGATRAAVDAGWAPYGRQIGQTGTTVKPEVYIAAGISGATQHVVGMKGSGRIVAINKDAEAPLMRIADVGVVGDLFEVVPALVEEVRRRKGS